VTGPKIATGAVGATNILGFTGSGSCSLDNVPDGTTYKRLNAQNINAGNNVNNPWNNSVVFLGSDGSYQGFTGSASSTSIAVPIAASFPIVISGWYKAGATTSNIFFLVGNETNGLGLKWTNAGVLSVVAFKAGTGTAGTTIATITRDTNWHWFSVKVTPGATPGSSDAWVIWLDGTTGSGTTGATAVTWGSTAVVTLDGPSGGNIAHFHMGSNNP
jgi:hypothetical protein